jgi:hypothetical protein
MLRVNPLRSLARRGPIVLALACALTSAVGVATANAAVVHGTATMSAAAGTAALVADPSSSATLASGQTVAGSIGAAGEADSYTFSASTGDRVIINAVATGGDLDTSIALYSPTGAEVATSASSDQLSSVLAEAGTYTVAVSDRGSTLTGSYNVTLQKIPGSLSYPGDPDGEPMYSGETVRGTIDVPSDMDAFTFSGTIGDHVVLKAVTTGGPLDTSMALYSPTGVLEGAWGSLDQAYCVLQETGTYTVVVSDLGLIKTGTYQLTVQGGAAGVAAAQPGFSPPGGAFGSPVDVTIASPTQGATIRYTTDGSTPDETSTAYAGTPVHLATTTVLKAVAFKVGMMPSPVTTQLFKITNGPLAVTGSGVSNPIAWGLKSGQWSTIWCGSDDAASWASVQILSSKGVVKTIYSGPLNKRPWDSSGHYTFPQWNGKDAGGRYLATGNYRYRITLSQAGAQVTTSGPIAVSRLRFTMHGSGAYKQQPAFHRYLYKGTVMFYYRALVPHGNTNVRIEMWDATGYWRFADSWTHDGATADWTWTVGGRFSASANGFQDWYLSATSDSAGKVANGALLEVTVMQ